MKKKFIYISIIGFLIGIIYSTPNTITAEDAPALLLQSDTPTVIAGLEQSIPQLIKKARIPGLQIALIRDGKIVWQKGFGVKKAGSKDQVTTGTIFEAASLTKPFFAYTVMKLVEEKLLDLDSPLVTYLPKEMIEKHLGHPLDQPGFHRDWLEKITARHILSHSSGMPHGERDKVYPLLFAPGSQYKYSAEGYRFLQITVEHLKGEPLDSIIKKYVIDPLGMTHSSMVWQDRYETALANGHGYFGQPEDLRKRSEANSAASLYTTAGDYSRFICAVMKGDGLTKESLDIMLKPQINVDKDNGLTWSLGFGLQADKNGTAFWQWGDYGIFRNYILAYPQHKLAVVYFTNSYYGLSICPDVIVRSIGGQALGYAFLGYKHYDFPVYEFAMEAYQKGPIAVEKLFPQMKEKYPADFGSEILQQLGAAFLNEKHYDTAIALYLINVNESKQPAKALYDLARAYVLKGDFTQAGLTYKKIPEVNKDNSVDPKSIEWDLAYIRALEKPHTLPENYLKSLAGVYNLRHIKYENGSLYYFRENGSLKNYSKMVALSKDTFIVEGLIYFRLTFEFDDQGLPVRVVGHYDSGQRDPSPRNK